MLTFPSPGSAEEQQCQQQRRQQWQEGQRPAQQPASPARAPPASTQFAEAALAAARELKAAAVAAAAASRSPVLVAFRVPACRLAFGEHLRLVGSCPELGRWDVDKAPVLQWAEGDDWTAAVALPPGEHAFKLLLVRQDGSLCWECGADRSLKVPSLPGAIAAEASAAGGPMLHVTCGAFGNTGATQLRADRARLQAAAAAAQERISQLLQHKQQLAARLAALEAEAAQSEVRVAGMKEDTRRLVRAELRRLQQRGIVQATVARLEGSTAHPQQAQLAQHANAQQQAQQLGHQLKHPSAERRKQKRAAARARLHSQYEQQRQHEGEAHAEHAVPAELALEVKLAAAEAAIRAALEPAAVPAEEQALLQASLLGYRHQQQAQPDLPAEPQLPAEPELAASQASWVAPEQPAATKTEAEAADAALGHGQEEEEAAQLAVEPAEEEEAAQLAVEPAEEEEAAQLAVEPAEEEEAAQLAVEPAEEEEAAQLAVEPAEEEAVAAAEAADAVAVAAAAAAEAAVAAGAFAAPQSQSAVVAAVPLAAAAAPAVAEPSALSQRLHAGSMAAEGGLLRTSTSQDGAICYSFAALPLQGSSASSGSNEQQQLSAYLLAERYLVPQLPPEAVAGLWRQLARTSLRLSFAAGHFMRPAAAAAAAAAAEGPPARAVVSSCAESLALAAKLEEVRAELAANAASRADDVCAASTAAAASAAEAAQAAQAVKAAADVQRSAEAVAQQPKQPSEGAAAEADRLTLTTFSIPGLAVCLAVHSLFQAAHSFWAAARTAVPAAGRLAADAAFWLAASAAAALPFLR